MIHIKERRGLKIVAGFQVCSNGGVYSAHPTNVKYRINTLNYVCRMAVGDILTPSTQVSYVELGSGESLLSSASDSASNPISSLEEKNENLEDVFDQARYMI